MTTDEGMPYLRWREGDEDVLRLGALVLRTRTLIEVLRLNPADAEARAEMVRLAGAASGLADRTGWTAASEIAGKLVRMLAATHQGPPPYGPMGLMLARLEAWIDLRLTNPI